MDWLTFIGAVFLQTYYNTPDFMYALGLLTLDTFAEVLYKPTLTIGGLRPVTIQLPDNYDPTVPAPLLIVLHGFETSGPWIDNYFGTVAYAKANGIVYMAPNGIYDAVQYRFWNATQACCDF